MALVQIATKPLTADQPSVFTTQDSPAGSLSFTVKNVVGFTVDQILLVGEFGSADAEIIKTSHTTAPSGSTITLATTTQYAHSSSTAVTVIPYDQIELTTATTLTNPKTILNQGNLMPVVATTETTNYPDLLNSVGFYFVRFFSTITGLYSAYSGGIPAAGYSLLNARSVINSALAEINKKTSEVLSDEFAFEQIDMCQIECVRELKRWSFMQKFDTILGQVTTGSWTIPMPSDVDDANTNKSIYKLRIGSEQKLTWVDKDRFDDMLTGVSYTTLLSPILLGATSIILTNSNDFASSGIVTIGANTYTYTANNTATDTLTIAAATTTNTAGTPVFQGATTGLPQYWTTYGGNIFYYPVTAPSYNGKNMYMDYYSTLVKTTTDTQNIVIPDPALIQYFLCWKFLKRLNNGEDTPASTSYMGLYMDRKTKMKNKEVKNRTFKLKARFNDFSSSSGLDSGDDRNTRTANYSNTGF